jgi:hypothetical protein
MPQLSLLPQVVQGGTGRWLPALVSHCRKRQLLYLSRAEKELMNWWEYALRLLLAAIVCVVIGYCLGCANRRKEEEARPRRCRYCNRTIPRGRFCNAICRARYQAAKE